MVPHAYDKVVALLIAYWQGEGPKARSVGNTCRQLADKVIQGLPASASEAILRNPQAAQMYAADIQDALSSVVQSDPVAAELLRSLSEAGRPPSAQQVHVEGDHTVVITVGRDISGLTIQPSPTSQSPPDVAGSQAAPATPGQREQMREQMEEGEMWDVFVSHAWEDKETIARPLAEALRRAGLNVWYDEFTLTLGDSLRRSIDRGLSQSRYGVVILSPHFFAKEWPQRELDGLTAREVSSGKTILPIWHNVTRQDVERFSPVLADRLGVSTSKGLDIVVQEILRALRLSEPAEELVIEFFQDYFPQLSRHTSTGMPLWLEGDILKAFKSGIGRARFSKLGQLTTRHILIGLLELKDGISAQAISHLGGDELEMAKQLLSNLSEIPQPVPRVEPTLSVREIVTSLEHLHANERLGRLDDGRVLEVALELGSGSVTIDELLNDLQCNKEQLLQAISEARAVRMSTPPREKG